MGIWKYFMTTCKNCGSGMYQGDRCPKCGVVDKVDSPSTTRSQDEPPKTSPE